MPLKIHKLDPSPSCRSVFMIADILNLKYETEEINTLAGDQMKPEFLEKNPLHSIPLLEDGDFVLADSHAIVTYLVSKYGADKRSELYPSDLALRATIDQRLFFDAITLFPVCRAIVIGVLREKEPGPTEQQIAAANEGYAVLEKYLEKTRFVACDYLTLADVAVVATVSSLVTLIPLDEKYEKVRNWLNTLEKEEWYQKSNVPGLTHFDKFLNGAMAWKNKA